MRPPRAELQGELSGLRLSRALAGVGLAEDSEGVLSGRTRLRMTGLSMAALLGTAEGDAHLLTGGGQLDALLVELAGLDLGEALVASVGRQDEVPIRCAYLGLEAAEGTLRIRHGLLDTPDTLFVLEGELDLGTETLDLILTPRPRDPSLLSSASPVVITGRFASPEVELGSEALVRGTAAAALAVVAGPLAALVPLVETGTEERSGAPCGQLLQEAQAQAEGPASSD